MTINTSFFWSVFSRSRTEYGAEKTPYLDTFHAVPLYIYDNWARNPTPLIYTLYNLYGQFFGFHFLTKSLYPFVV